MNQVIVGLWGPAGVGKDTVAEALGWPKVGFADSLKADLQSLFDSVGIDIEDREQKEKVRPIMIATGSCLRAINPHHWIKRLRLPKAPAVSIKDVRYLNEIISLWGRGGLVVELTRDGFGPANEEEHRSFAEIRTFLEQTGLTIPVVENTTPAEAANQIRRILNNRAYALGKGLK